MATWAASMPASRSSAWRTSSRPASVRRTLRPTRSSTATPVAFSSPLSCWDTAEEV